MAKIREWNAASVMELANLHKISEVLFTAIEVDLFAHLREPVTLDELCRKLNFRREPLEVIVAFLVQLKLLCQSGDLYCNHPDAEPYLLRQSPNSLAGMILLERQVRNKWPMNLKLLERLKGDERENPWVQLAQTEEDTALFMDAMRLGYYSSLHLLRKVQKRLRDVPSPVMLDLGCGPGVFSNTFCTFIPALKSVMVDQIPNPRLHPDLAKLEDRVTYFVKDFMAEPLEGVYDLVLLSNVCHFFSEEKLRVLFRKLQSHLRPTGTVLVHDFFHNENLGEVTHANYYSLDWMANHGVKFTFTLEEMARLLDQCGYRVAEMAPLPQLPTSYLFASLSRPS